MVAAVEHHVGRHATARSIRRADELVGAARFAMIDLRQAVAQRTGVLSDEAVLFLLGTYYQTDDLPRWIAMMRQLVDEVRTSHHAPEQLSDGRPRVLVIGSPILFPQYKVPALIHEAGLALVEAVDASSTARFSSLTPEERRGGVARLIETIARKHYVLDASGARAVNQPMEQYLSYLLQATGIEGIVCHVLKGHIEHDFELARLERFLDQLDIPVLRLETDYQYQDVEQLRIRLEAFAETLEQRAFVASRSSRLRCA
jgi:benzoyl-CoA reductase/2-hydroxyglutaryl-CoA dehydratase subunit BcrC/BadD/HgdB